MTRRDYASLLGAEKALAVTLTFKPGRVLKGAYCWYGLCNRCGIFKSASSQPEAFRLLEAHFKTCSISLLPPLPQPSTWSTRLCGYCGTWTNGYHTCPTVMWTSVIVPTPPIETTMIN